MPRFLMRIAFVLALAVCFGAKTVNAQTPATIEDELGTMIMVGFRGADLPDGSPFLNDIRRLHLGGVLLFDKDISSFWNILAARRRNIVDRQQLARLTRTLREAASPRPLLIAVDQEGGNVRRLKPEHGFIDLPSAEVMGRGSPGQTAAIVRPAAAEMREAGFNMVMAPDADVNVDPQSPAIGKLGRSFGAEPGRVAAHAAAFAGALRENGIIPVLKHFPGHGSAAKDSHLGLTDVTRTWRGDVELEPFRRLIAEGFVGAVMVAHVYNRHLDPAYPASLSRRVITDLLRHKLGWQGVVMTDDLGMRAITDHYSLDETIERAVLAGADILVFGNNTRRFDPDLPAKAHDALGRLVKSGKISESRIRESVARIRAMERLAGIENASDRK